MLIHIVQIRAHVPARCPYIPKLYSHDTRRCTTTWAASKVVYLLIVSWVLYPFTTYWMCLPVPNACKNSFLWKWVMDVKRNQG